MSMLNINFSNKRGALILSLDVSAAKEAYEI